MNYPKLLSVAGFCINGFKPTGTFLDQLSDYQQGRLLVTLLMESHLLLFHGATLSLSSFSTDTVTQRRMKKVVATEHVGCMTVVVVVT
jgi:hypothetical protein